MYKVKPVFGGWYVDDSNDINSIIGAVIFHSEEQAQKEADRLNLCVWKTTTLSQIDRLKEALAMAKEHPVGVDELDKACLAGIQSVIDELMVEYVNISCPDKPDETLKKD